ncbi:MAG: glycosyl hydrolase family 28 protein [Alistipes indistinctus]
MTIVIKEGAALMASTSPYDYDYVNGTAALIVADTAKNIGITGKGLIDGRGTLVTGHYNTQAAQGNLAAGKNTVPALIYMNGCTGVTVEGILLNNSAEDVAIFNNCTDVTVTITVDSKLNPPAGVVLEELHERVKLNESFIDVPAAALQTKGAASKAFGNQQHHPNGKNLAAQIRTFALRPLTRTRGPNQREPCRNNNYSPSATVPFSRPRVPTRETNRTAEKPTDRSKRNDSRHARTNTNIKTDTGIN